MIFTLLFAVSVQQRATKARETKTTEHNYYSVPMHYEPMKPVEPVPVIEKIKPFEGRLQSSTNKWMYLWKKTKYTKQETIKSIENYIIELQKDSNSKEVDKLSDSFQTKRDNLFKKEMTSDFAQKKLQEEIIDFFGSKSGSALGEIAVQQFPNLKVDFIATELFLTFRTQPKEVVVEPWEVKIKDFLSRLYDFNKAMNH